MTSEDLLAILKFSLPAVGFVSILLGKLKEVRREGPDGEKRLTFYGRVLTGLTVLSAFISLFSTGFEAIVKRQADARNQLETIRKVQEQQTEAAKRQASELAFRDAEATRARELEARIVDQKLAFLAEAAEAQRRAATISHQLGEASAARLSDAEHSLAEFAKINDPLRKIAAMIDIELNLTGPEVTRYWDWLQAQHGVPFEAHRHEANPNERVVLSANELGREDRFQYAAIGNAVSLAFYAPGAAPAAALRAATSGGALRTVDRPLSSGASFLIQFDRPTVTANLIRRIVTARYEATLEPDREGGFGGRKLSMADVGRLTPILTIKRLGANRFPRGPDRMTALELTFNDNDTRFRLAGQAAVTDDPVAFIVR